MKKSLLLVGAMILVAELSQGQTLIPKAGVTLSKIALEDNEGMKSRIGFTLGVGYNIPVSELFSIQPELNFVQKGSKSKFSDSDEVNDYLFTSKEETNLTINYLEVPVLAKVTFGTGTKFYLNAGPSIAYGLGGKKKYEEVNTTTYQGVTETVTFKTEGKVKFEDEPGNYRGEDIYIDNRIDVGVQFGGGAIIANKIMIDVRYGLGFSNLVEGEDDKSQNRVLQFTVGIPLSLK